GTHWDFEDAGGVDVATDADELHPHRAILALSLEPVSAVRKDGRSEREGLDVVDDRGLVPETVGTGERRLVAWFGALTLDRLQKSALLAANVAARAHENLEIKAQVAAQDFLPKKARVVTTVDLFLKNFLG